MVQGQRVQWAAGGSFRHGGQDGASEVGHDGRAAVPAEAQASPTRAAMATEVQPGAPSGSGPVGESMEHGAHGGRLQRPTTAGTIPLPAPPMAHAGVDASSVASSSVRHVHSAGASRQHAAGSLVAGKEIGLLPALLRVGCQLAAPGVQARTRLTQLPF